MPEVLADDVVAAGRRSGSVRVLLLLLLVELVDQIHVYLVDILLNGRCCSATLLLAARSGGIL